MKQTSRKVQVRGKTMGILEGGILAILSAIGGWIGGFLGSYSKKKGENLATKEDFNDLKEQTRQLTQATKEIEGRISHDIWNAQRRTELSSAAVIAAVETLANAERALKGSLIEIKRTIEGEAPSPLKDSLSDGMDIMFALDRIRFKFALMAGPSVIINFMKLSDAYTKALLTMNITEFDEEKAKVAFAEFQSSLAAFLMAVRNELNFPLELNEEAIKYLSSGSSEAQSTASAS
jgi:hypothetical protein